MHIGSIYNFGAGGRLSRGQDGECKNCKEQLNAGVLSKAQVPITGQLLYHVQHPDKPLQSLARAEVETYLTKHLKWRVVKVGELTIATHASNMLTKTLQSSLPGPLSTLQYSPRRKLLLCKGLPNIMMILNSCRSLIATRRCTGLRRDSLVVLGEVMRCW